MQFALSTNPLAPLMWVALVICALALVATVAWLVAANRKYPTASARRAWRRSEPKPLAVILGAALIFGVLGLAVAATIGDIITYSHNVQQVQAVVAKAGAQVSARQAKQLLGNDNDYIFKAVVAGDRGLVGKVRAGSQKIQVVHLGADHYRLALEQAQGGNS